MSRFAYNSTSGALKPISGYGPSTCILESSTSTTVDSVDTFSFTSSEILATSAVFPTCDVPLVTPVAITQTTGSYAISFNSSDNVGSVRLYVM